MKNSVLFAAGLMALTVAVVPFSSASRNAYHAYITSQANESQYRHFTERRRMTSEVEVTATATANQNAYTARYQRNSRVNFSEPVGAGRVSDTNTTYVEATSRTAVDTKLRPFATRAGVAPWRQNLQRTSIYSRVSDMSLPNQNLTFETFTNDAFSVALPAEAQATAEDAHAFIFGDAVIRIKHFGEDTCSNAYGFKGCAINVTRSENALAVGGEGQLVALERIVRNSYKSDSVLEQINLQTSVYTEEFTAEFPDGIDYTLYRYVVQDVDGGVYYVEVKSPRGVARNYLAVADKIFDTFRIYTQE